MLPTHKSRWNWLIPGRFYYEEITFSSFEVLFEGVSWQGQCLCRACFLTCPAMPKHYVHFVTSACLRAAILVMSAQGVRPWANPCPRRAPLPIPLLAYAAAEDALHLRNAKIPASQLQFCSSPQLPPQTYTKRGLTLSFHRWDRCHTSRQLLLPGKHESPSREAAEVPQTVTFSFF